MLVNVRALVPLLLLLGLPVAALVLMHRLARLVLVRHGLEPQRLALCNQSGLLSFNLTMF